MKFLPRPLASLAQDVHREDEEAAHTLAVKVLVHVHVIAHCLPLQLPLGARKVEREERCATSAFETARRLPLVGHEAVQTGAQVRAELGARRIVPLEES